MGFVKYSQVNLDLVGDEKPDWADDSKESEEKKKEAAKAALKNLEKDADKKVED